MEDIWSEEKRTAKRIRALQNISQVKVAELAGVSLEQLQEREQDILFQELVDLYRYTKEKTTLKRLLDRYKELASNYQAELDDWVLSGMKGPCLDMPRYRFSSRMHKAHPSYIRDILSKVHYAMEGLAIVEEQIDSSKYKIRVVNERELYFAAYVLITKDLIDYVKNYEGILLYLDRFKRMAKRYFIQVAKGKGVKKIIFYLVCCLLGILEEKHDLLHSAW